MREGTMRHTIAVIVALGLALAACGKSTVDPESAYEVLDNQGIDISFSQYEAYSDTVCHMFETNDGDTYTVVNLFSEATGYSVDDSLAIVASITTAYCPQ